MKKIKIEIEKKTMKNDRFEEMMDRLPSNIKETSVLRSSSKKVLAALLELLLHSRAYESGVIFASNATLRKISGIGSRELLPSIKQLIDYDLISRKVGDARTQGKQATASEYTINFKVIKNPIKKKNFDDFFANFLDDPKTSGMPMGTPITITTTITTTTPITTTTTTSNTTTTSTANTTSKTNTKATSNMSINAKDLIEKKQTEEKEQKSNSQVEETKPSTYKTLGEYYKRRIEKETKGKTLQELEQLQETYKHEIEHEYSHIMNSKNIYLYAVKPCMERLKDKLLENEFSNCMVITSIED